MTDQPNDGGLPLPRIYWKVTDPDGTIVQEGYSTPAGARAAGLQGKDQSAQDAPESDGDHGLD